MRTYILKMINEQTKENIAISELTLRWGQDLKGLVTVFCYGTLNKNATGDYTVIARDKNGSKFFYFLVKKTENHFTVSEAYDLESQEMEKLCLL